MYVHMRACSIDASILQLLKANQRASSENFPSIFRGEVEIVEGTLRNEAPFAFYDNSASCRTRCVCAQPEEGKTFALGGDFRKEGKEGSRQFPESCKQNVEL